MSAVKSEKQVVSTGAGGADDLVKATLCNVVHVEEGPAAAANVEGGVEEPQASGAVATWNDLIAQVQTRLRAMPADECFSKALEVQVMARGEVGSRSRHLSNAMDLMEPAKRPETENTSSKSNSLPLPPRPSRAELELSKQKPVTSATGGPLPCMKMPPPLPSRCEHDNCPDIPIPIFQELVNFPTARYYKKCVMCNSDEFPIPKQNKGICINCDSAVWVVNPSGMQIKWCKGCKNFRKWSDFGNKGHSTKCEMRRQQQAKRYAEHKHKTTIL